MEATKDLEKYTYELLAERGVTLEDIAELVFLRTKTVYAEFKTGRVSHKCGFCTI